MNEQTFAIGIGSTGIRNLEDFAHTCAMGMHPTTEIYLLPLDTDLETENFKRLQSLIEGAYQKLSTFRGNKYPLKVIAFSMGLHHFV